MTNTINCLSFSSEMCKAVEKKLFTVSINPDASVFVLRDIPETFPLNPSRGTSDAHLLICHSRHKSGWTRVSLVPSSFYDNFIAGLSGALMSALLLIM